ncbi:MAG: SDR family oxidoreductase [Candidatus Lernaella stagnicola]|nr:SDR family oxidoreductase [Candidatus Lernaella stagnicola]
MRFLWKAADALAEATVVLSYGSPGYRLRTHLWNADALSVDLTNKVMVVTGANSGLGKAAATQLAGLGATVVMVCRDRSRGEAAQREIRDRHARAILELEIADLSDMDTLRELARRLIERHPAIDVLINNAGVMLHERKLSADGIEMTFATNVLGGFVLTHALLPQLERAAAPRIVHVTSGGMYTQRIDVQDLQFEHKEYDGVVAYAQSKRAQVVLSELWAERLATRGITSNCMHPGWAATPGVERSLPRFYRWLRPLLRDHQQGADTAVWLAAGSEAEGVTGRLFFDRQPRRTHIFRRTRHTPQEAQRLWEICELLGGINNGDAS